MSKLKGFTSIRIVVGFPSLAILPQDLFVSQYPSSFLGSVQNLLILGIHDIGPSTIFYHYGIEHFDMFWLRLTRVSRYGPR